MIKITKEKTYKIASSVLLLVIISLLMFGTSVVTKRITENRMKDEMKNQISINESMISVQLQTLLQQNGFTWNDIVTLSNINLSNN